MIDIQLLPPDIADAAERFREDKGVSVEEAAGSDDPMLVELFLIVAGYIDDDPTLATPRDN